ncbi:MAG: DUF1819 family protein [Methanobrevibacter sp.]|nr:DUF1819 family protein [Methanobrevibacter sp.]
MKYSSGLMALSFWYIETKKTAKYLIQGLSRKEIIELAIEENIYQVETENRKKRIANTCVTRLINFPTILLEDIINSDITSSKMLVLISILKNDKLFFEFMHEVFRNKIIIGEKYIEKKDLNIFFDEKKLQSETVNNWVPKTVQRLKLEYVNILRESGLLSFEKKDKKAIIFPILDYKVEQDIISNNLSPYLYVITGEK